MNSFYTDWYQILVSHFKILTIDWYLDPDFTFSTCCALGIQNNMSIHSAGFSSFLKEDSTLLLKECLPKKISHCTLAASESWQHFWFFWNDKLKNYNISHFKTAAVVNYTTKKEKNKQTNLIISSTFAVIISDNTSNKWRLYSQFLDRTSRISYFTENHYTSKTSYSDWDF